MVDILKKKKAGIRERTVILTNKDGIKRKYLLRAFRPGDESGIINCVKEEHGDTYFKKFFYDEAALCEKAQGEEYIFFVAADVTTHMTSGDIPDKLAGIEILRMFTKYGDDYIEPASQIVRKEHRGFGLSGTLVDYTFSIAKSLKPAALFSHVAMYHFITQRACEAYGMEPVGFEIGSFLTEVMKNSYLMCDVKKYSAGTLCLPVEKRDAGTVYLPDELTEYGRMIYNALGVKVCIRCGDVFSGAKELPQNSMLELSYENEINRYITINTITAGEDIYDQVAHVTGEHIREGKNLEGWVYLLLLDIDTPVFLEQYKRFKSMGFFFGGLQPLCGIHERAFMYKVGDLELKMETYCVTEKFDIIREWIGKFYKARMKG